MSSRLCFRLSENAFVCLTDLVGQSGFIRVAAHGVASSQGGRAGGGWLGRLASQCTRAMRWGANGDPRVARGTLLPVI